MRQAIELNPHHKVEGNVSTKLPVARNTTLLSAGMAALSGMNQLSVAVATITFVAVTGFEGFVGLGPAIFLGTAALAAFPAGRAMDRFGRPTGGGCRENCARRARRNLSPRRRAGL
jgi:hypothetical protein